MKKNKAAPIGGCLLSIVLFTALAGPTFAQATPTGPSSPPPLPTSPTPTPAAPQPAPPATVVVPFQFEGDMIVVPAMIDGAGPFSLGIDSGAETVMITQHVADQAKIAVKNGTVALSGTTGNYVPVPQAMVDTVQVGNAVVKKPFCTVSPEPIAIDGYIGAPLFNFYVVQIDFGNRTLTCIPPASFRPDPSDMPIPIILGKHRVPIVKGEIAGVPASLQIDTGSMFPAELTPDFVKKNDFTHKFTKLGTTGSISVGGPTVSSVYSVPSIVLGAPPAELPLPPDVPTLFLNPAGAPVLGDYDGRIGAPALAGLVVTFDYMNSTLYVRPSVPTASSPSQPTQPVSPTSPATSSPADQPTAK